ncbi:uncharacterized protein LOC131930354 [Physella acuta]|uniref:uncharacterized protein LOC131930354 n=1 Tax=Physella acuta TaxID=109671 RepID=UPI0027DC7948|nr:uncharacterized protein LOC131930354 [Physella acuta]
MMAAWMIYCMFSLLLPTCTHQTGVDKIKFEEGKMQYEVLQRQSEMPKYGHCWRNAMVLIKKECKRLTDVAQTRLALAYLNCFLGIQGRPGYECDETEDVSTCVRHMNEVDRSSLTTFFTHTQNICYFLQAQVWQEETDMTINRLSATSSQVAEQLEQSEQVQRDILQSQNQSLHTQHQLLVQTHNLSSIINVSSQSVRLLFEDLKESTKEQKQIMGALFDQLTKLQSTILGEVSGFYSLFYYLLSVLVCYLLTSTSRTSGARIWLFLIWTVNVILEQSLLRWIASVYLSSGTDNEQVYWLQKQSRRVSLIPSAIVLAVCFYNYKDINMLNNQLLMEIRKQNSELCKFLSGSSAILHGQPATEAVGTSKVTEAVDSSDSDYTSDNGDDSDDESDKTFILPENRDTDAESFLTLTDNDSTVTDLSSLHSELNDLNTTLSSQDQFTNIRSWLDRSHGLDDKEDVKPPKHSSIEVGEAIKTSPYNLRPRKTGASPNISPASRVESAKSFSKTVHHMQQITEKNSRLIRAYIQNAAQCSSPDSTITGPRERNSILTLNARLTRSSPASSRK